MEQKLQETMELYSFFLPQELTVLGGKMQEENKALESSRWPVCNLCIKGAGLTTFYRSA